MGRPVGVLGLDVHVVRMMHAVGVSRTTSHHVHSHVVHHHLVHHELIGQGRHVDVLFVAEVRVRHAVVHAYVGGHAVAHVGRVRAHLHHHA